MSSLTFIDENSGGEFLTNAFVGDATNQHTDIYSGYEHVENSCDDNNDNSFSVTGEQNLSHMHDNTTYYDGVPEQQKALILNGNEMRQRKNLLFNLINSIMKYLGSRNNANKNDDNDDDDCITDSEIIEDVDSDSDKLVMNDRFSNSCDNRSNNIETLNDKDGEMEFVFDENEECQTEVAMVPKSDAYAVTLK